MKAKSFKFLGLIALTVTLFVACGTENEKKISGVDITQNFLKTHATKFTSPTNDSYEFTAKGGVINSHIQVINVQIKYHGSGVFIANTKGFSDFETIETTNELVKTSAPKLQDVQTSKVICEFSKSGQLIAVKKIPLGFDKDKYSWEVRNQILLFPQLKYIMTLSLDPSAVSGIQVLETKKSFFSEKVLDETSTSIKKLCKKRMANNSHYSYDQQFSLPEFKDDRLVILNSSLSRYDNVKRLLSKAHNLGKRIYIREGQKMPLFKEALADFLKHDKYRANIRNNNYDNSDHIKEFIPDTNNSEEYISISQNDSIQMLWENLDPDCGFKLKLNLSGVKSKSIEFQEQGHLPLKIKNYTITKVGQQKNRNCILTADKIKDIKEEKYPLVISIKLFENFYLDAFELGIYYVDKTGDKLSLISRSPRFIPLK